MHASRLPLNKKKHYTLETGTYTWLTIHFGNTCIPMYPTLETTFMLNPPNFNYNAIVLKSQNDHLNQEK